MTGRLVAMVTAAAVSGAVGGAVVTSHRVEPATTPDLPTVPCAVEDSPGPCYWDAGTRGNGHGRSFWTDETGRVFYLAPTSNEVTR